MTIVKAGRGGARLGAGRKPRIIGTGAAVPKRLILDTITVEVLLSVGDGNASKGCMMLAYDYLKNKITL